MQLIVGCRARGASWAGSETLVIPGNRLTIHVHAHERIHNYWFRIRVYVYRLIHFVWRLISRTIIASKNLHRVWIKRFNAYIIL